MSNIKNNKDKSFRLDGKARSFRVIDFTLRDLPLLAVAFVLVTVFGLVFGWLPTKVLSEKWLWIYCGFGLGFAFGVTSLTLLQRRFAKAKDLDSQSPPTK
jgi:cyanate permease